MSQDIWKDERPVAASPRLSRSPAKNYYAPELKSVGVKIEFVDPFFEPKPQAQDGKSAVFANLPNKSCIIPKGGQFILDCGFSLIPPTGYRVNFSCCILGMISELVESERFKVNLMNLGEETILSNKQQVGKMWLEPIYFFSAL